MLGLSACGGGGESGTDKAAVAAAIKKELREDKTFGELPEDELDEYIDCSAAAMTKNAEPDDLQAFVDGEKKADDVKAKKGSDLDSEYESCAKTTGLM
ncbi:MAG: hypothetical protein ACRDQF_02460 [Thermocrispum sp.]